jgi:glutathione S-transferase
MKLYGCANSRSLRALWALEQVRADYEYVPVDFFRGEGRTQAFLALNPGGKVLESYLDRLNADPALIRARKRERQAANS